MNVALVGGGKAAVILLEFFNALKDVTVVGISDPREDAPGISRARNFGIFTTKQTEELLKRPGINIIVELTGNGKVQAELSANLNPGQEILYANCARLMCDIIEAQNFGDRRHNLEIALHPSTPELRHSFEVMAPVTEIQDCP